MVATVIGVFDTREQAEKAVREMRNKGFANNEISVLAKGQARQGAGGGGGGDQEAGGDVSEGVWWGGALGGIAGLLAGIGALTIPGIGPVVAAGPLAATLGGAVTGGVAGGLLDLGIPEERGRFYEGQLKSGKVLAVVQADSARIDTATQLLRDNGANNVESHVGSPKASQTGKRSQ
ncbi:general stress protein [Carboxydochorda subterranea]|uniref:General stress protein n=1 Tax=Carboxydichorda subterranea TaxID=3109565 RepID=A0ABZ1C025_9FIRM|nr:general stress protein [Limnochorda sp. L945t]WRP18353.1 general stress protein [Limnochorda sp. L945t]